MGAGRKPNLVGLPPRIRPAVLPDPPVLEPGAVPKPSGSVADPLGLTPAERKVWDWLAPLALERQTLTPATMPSFTLLCQQWVLERALAEEPGQRGGGNHRGVTARVQSFLAAFDLLPMGRPPAAVGGVPKPKTNLELLKRRRAEQKLAG